MIMIFTCPICGRENEVNVKLENEFDYIEQDDWKELSTECDECSNDVELELSLSVKE